MQRKRNNLSASVAKSGSKAFSGPNSHELMLVEEHCATIEKAMAGVRDNTATAKTQSEVSQSAQQAVRWIAAKEEHATKIQAICSQYFLTQRIKPGQADYNRKLELLHGMMVAAMKAKQTVEPEHVAKIRSLLGEFEKLYFNE